jgi:hypothetical protein
MNTNERILRNGVVQRVHDAQEEHRRAGHRGRDVAEHEDLRAARAHRLGLDDDRHAAGLQRRAHRPADVDVLAPALAAVLLALGLQPALELGDDAVHGSEVLQRSRRQRAVELVERALGRQGLRALDLPALELAAQHRLEAAQLVARQPVAARVVGRQVGLRLGAQAHRTADALHVDADDPEPSPWRPNAAIARRARSRIALSLPSRIAAAICWRSASSAWSPDRSPPPAGDASCSRRPPGRRPPRPRGRRSGRRRGRRPGGRRATWPASSPAPP